MLRRTKTRGELVLLLRDLFPPERPKLNRRKFSQSQLTPDRAGPTSMLLELHGTNLWVWKRELRARLLWQCRASTALPVFKELHTRAYLWLSWTPQGWFCIASSFLPSNWSEIFQTLTPSPGDASATPALLQLMQQKRGLVCTFDETTLLLEFRRGFEVSFQATQILA